MTRAGLDLVQCQVVEEELRLSLDQLCQACSAERELVQQLVAHGVLQPQGAEPQAWVFAGASLRRTRTALRLLRDLELNLPGAALAVDLLDEIARLQRELGGASGLVLRDAE
jgi:chaperone modulatory protein CbpM